MFLLPNGTFFVELIILLILIGIVWRFIVPPIRKAMQDRHDRVERQMEESDKARKRFAEADSRYREALAEARSESSKIRDEARSEGNQIVEELRSHANAEVTRVRESGEAQLAEQRERVFTELRGSVSELAAKLASRVTGAQLDDSTGRAQAERLLDERDREAGVVGAASGSGSTGGA